MNDAHSVMYCFWTIGKNYFVFPLILKMYHIIEQKPRVKKGWNQMSKSDIGRWEKTLSRMQTRESSLSIE